MWQGADIWTPIPSSFIKVSVTKQRTRREVGWRVTCLDFCIIWFCKPLEDEGGRLFETSGKSDPSTQHHTALYLKLLRCIRSFCNKKLQKYVWWLRPSVCLSLFNTSAVAWKVSSYLTLKNFATVCRQIIILTAVGQKKLTFYTSTYPFCARISCETRSVYVGPKHDFNKLLVAHHTTLCTSDYVTSNDIRTGESGITVAV